MKHLIKLAAFIAVSCEGKYLPCFFYVYGAYMLFNFIEAGIEFLIFGERFSHGLDYLFGLVFLLILTLSNMACDCYRKLRLSK